MYLQSAKDYEKSLRGAIYKKKNRCCLIAQLPHGNFK